MAFSESLTAGDPVTGVGGEGGTGGTRPQAFLAQEEEFTTELKIADIVIDEPEITKNGCGKANRLEILLRAWYCEHGAGVCARDCSGQSGNHQDTLFLEWWTCQPKNVDIGWDFYVHNGKRLYRVHRSPEIASRPFDRPVTLKLPFKTQESRDDEGRTGVKGLRPTCGQYQAKIVLYVIRGGRWIRTNSKDLVLDCHGCAENGTPSY